MNRDTLDKKTPVPLYYQIYEVVKERIESGDYKEGEVLPSESSLCDSLGVSRITIRNAMARLENEGYIVKEQGRNSTVAKRNKGNVWIDLRDFTTDLQDNSVVLVSDVIKTGMETPSEVVRKSLRLSEQDKVYRVERVRNIEGVPVIYSISFLATWISIEFDALQIHRETSLKEVFKDNGVIMMYCDETLEAKIPNEKVKNLLKLDDETAVFFRARITYDEKERPFEYVLNYYDANYYRYYIKKGKTQ